MYIGAAIGVIGAATLGFLWIKYSHLINIGRFMKVTSVFLFFFTIHLFFYGIYEFAEAGVIPFLDNHEVEEFAEAIVKEGFFSALMAYGMILIPGYFLIQGYLNSRKISKAA